MSILYYYDRLSIKVMESAFERDPTYEFPIRQLNPERFSLHSYLSIQMVDSLADNTLPPPPVSPRETL